MDLFFVRVELPEAGPEIKYFLIKSIQLFGFYPWEYVKVEDIAKQVGVGKYVVSAATKYFDGRGCLIKDKVIAGKGRPSIRFKWSRDLHAKLASSIAAKDGDIHPIIIDKLLDLRELSPVENETSQLSISNKLLLIVLLAYADFCGVVRCLSMSDLVKLTGMSRDRLESQFFKLKRLGYIRSSVSGTTSPRLFGLMKSVYFLNLKGVLAADSGDTFILPAIKVTDISLFSEAQKIEQAASMYRNYERRRVFPENKGLPLIGLANELFPFDPKFLEILSLFSGPVPQGFRSILQVKLEEYASVLLSDFWSEVSDGRAQFFPADESSSVRDDTSERIREIIGGRIREYINQRVALAQHDILISFVLNIALSIARKVHAGLSRLFAHSGIKLTGNEMFTILPSLYKGQLREHMAVEMFVGLKAGRNPKCIIMSAHNDLVIEVVECELGVQDRIRYSLLTP